MSCARAIMSYLRHNPPPPKKKVYVSLIYHCKHFDYNLVIFFFLQTTLIPGVVFMLLETLSLSNCWEFGNYLNGEK